MHRPLNRNEHKNGTFSLLFKALKFTCQPFLALLQTLMTDFPILLYTLTSEIPTLKNYPFRAEPPRVGHHKEYPPGFSLVA